MAEKLRKLIRHKDAARLYTAMLRRGPNAIQALSELPGDAGRLVAPLALDADPAYYAPIADAIIQAALQNRLLDRWNSRVRQAKRDAKKDDVEQKTRARLQIGKETLPSEVAKKLKVVIIGSGPGALIPGRLLADLNLDVSYITPDTNLGGIWAEGSGKWSEEKDFGLNNPPGDLTVQNATLHVATVKPDRRTRVMKRFLGDVADPDIRSKIIPGTATGVDYDGKSKHTVHYTDTKGARHTVDADFVIVAAGNVPLPIEGKKSKDYFPLHNTHLFPDDRTKRWPTRLSDEEIIRMSEQGQQVLVVGLGNSTMTQLREVREINERLERLGKPLIKIRVLTHLNQAALDNPDKRVRQRNGKYAQVSRNPAEGELTRLELDIPESRALYEASRQYMVSGVTSCTFVKDRKSGRIDAKITRVNDNNEEREEIIENVGELDVFTGYGNDSDLMRACGFTVLDRRGTVKTRRSDGRAISDGRHVYAIGATAFTRENPSNRVIAGIIQRAGEIGLSIVSEAAERYARERKRTGTTRYVEPPRRRVTPERSQLATEVLSLKLPTGDSSFTDTYQAALIKNVQGTLSEGPAVTMIRRLIQLQQEGIQRTDPIIAEFPEEVFAHIQQDAFAQALTHLGRHLGMRIQVTVSRDSFERTFKSSDKLDSQSKIIFAAMKKQITLPTKSRTSKIKLKMEIVGGAYPRLHRVVLA